MDHMIWYSPNKDQFEEDLSMIGYHMSPYNMGYMIGALTYAMNAYVLRVIALSSPLFAYQAMVL